MIDLALGSLVMDYLDTQSEVKIDLKRVEFWP